MEGPDAMMEVYACHENAISSLILESPPVWMTNTDSGPEGRSNYQPGSYLDRKQVVGCSESG